MCYDDVSRRPGLISRRASRKPASGSSPPPVAPSISSLSASSGDRWFASASLTVTGSDFDGSTATASFGATSGITGTGSSGTMTFTIPAAELWETGTKNVTVTSTAGTSNALTYTVSQPSDLLQDLRADRGITLNSSTVSAWTSQDTSGDSNRNVSQATASKQPTYNSSDSSYNNKPTLTFSDSGNRTIILSGAGAFTGGAYNQVTVVIVGHWMTTYASDSSTLRNGWMFDIHNTDSTKAWSVSRSGTGSVFGVDTRTPTTTVSVTNATRNVETPSVFVCYTGASGGLNTQATSKVYIRSTSTSASANGASTYVGLTGVSVGNTLRATNSGAIAKIAEVLVFNREFSSGDLTKLTDYLSTRYGSGVMTP